MNSPPVFHPPISRKWRFSPSFHYNSVRLQGCYGLYTVTAVTKLSRLSAYILNIFLRSIIYDMQHICHLRCTSLSWRFFAIISERSARTTELPSHVPSSYSKKIMHLHLH